VSDLKVWQLVYYEKYTHNEIGTGPAFLDYDDAKRFVDRVDRFGDEQAVGKPKSKRELPEIEEVEFADARVIELAKRDDCRYFVWFEDDQVASVHAEPISSYESLEIWDEREQRRSYRVDVIATGFDDAIAKARARWQEYLDSTPDLTIPRDASEGAE
jgi:hypothetical protein